MKGLVSVVGFALFGFGIATGGCGGLGGSNSSMGKEALGKALFFDTSLSNPTGQSCGTCHATASAFTDNRGTVTSLGILSGIFGSRQAPSAMYMSFSPSFSFDVAAGDYIGGQFWDGRAMTLEEQAMKPLLNPSEMHATSKQEVVDKVRLGINAEAFKNVFGADIFDDTNKAFAAVAGAIAEFERTSAFHPFSSKYDFFLQGKVSLSAAEARGLAVYENPSKGNCSACHPSRPGPKGEFPLFTDFSYDNIGLPKNPQNPFYTQPLWNNPDGNAFIDKGLFATTGRQADIGRFKVPTLRNVAVTGPYMHNGCFPTLTEVVRFYNERDLGGFAPPEVSQGVNHEELGNLQLTGQEQADLVAFLEILTDGYTLAPR